MKLDVQFRGGNFSHFWTIYKADRGENLNRFMHCLRNIFSFVLAKWTLFKANIVPLLSHVCTHNIVEPKKYHGEISPMSNFSKILDIIFLDIIGTTTFPDINFSRISPNYPQQWNPKVRSFPSIRTALNAPHYLEKRQQRKLEGLEASSTLRKLYWVESGRTYLLGGSAGNWVCVVHVWSTGTGEQCAVDFTWIVTVSRRFPCVASSIRVSQKKIHLPLLGGRFCVDQLSQSKPVSAEKLPWGQ